MCHRNHSLDAKVGNERIWTGLALWFLFGFLHLDIKVMLLAIWFARLEPFYFEDPDVLLLCYVFRLFLELGSSGLLQVFLGLRGIEVGQFINLKVSKWLLPTWIAIIILFIYFRGSFSLVTWVCIYATTERAWWWHSLEVSLHYLPVDELFENSTFPLTFDSILYDSYSNLSNDGVGFFRLPILEFSVVKACFIHESKVIIVDSQIFISLHLRDHIFVVPGKLQELFKAGCSFLMIFQKPIDVTKLFISCHFLLVHSIFLTDILETFEGLFSCG